MTRKKVIRWAVLWRSKNRLDGKREYFTFDDCLPALFCKRREARKHIEEKYGYIRNRADLKAEPHGWKMPLAVRCEVILRRLR